MVETETKAQRYESYKNSGVEWLGEIPEHWNLGRLGSILNPVSSKNHPNQTLLSITREKGVIVRDMENEDENHNYIPDDLTGYKLLKKGQFGMNKMEAWQGSYGVSSYTGIVSPAYYTFEFTQDIEPRFFHIAIRSKLYVSFFGKASDGVRIGQWDLSKERMKRIPLAIPPLSEQTAIAQFLDNKTTKIDQAIAIKEQQISLLKERKQILIHKAVTRGLNPNVKLKDSGVEWIGEIPEGWTLSKLGFLTYKIGDGLHGTPKYTDGTEYYFINGNNLSTGNIEITEQTKTISEREYFLNKKELTKNTLLLSINGTIGNVAFYCGEKVMLGKSAAYLNFHKDVNIEYIKYFLESSNFKNYYELELSGSTINNFSLYSIVKTPIVIPSNKEQKGIVDYLETASQKIETAIGLKQQEIAKLKEYKSSLINGVVTGKVRIN